MVVSIRDLRLYRGGTFEEWFSRTEKKQFFAIAHGKK